MSITIPLPWTKPPLSLNDRAQRHKGGAQKIAAALEDACLAIRAAGVKPIVGAVVTTHYRAPDLRRRDADNLAATHKVCQDALVATGVIPRDDWVHIPSSAQRIHPPSEAGPAMWLELTDITYFKEPPA